MKIDFNHMVGKQRENKKTLNITTNQYKNSAEKELLEILQEDRFYIEDELSWKDKVKKSYSNLQYLLKHYPITINDVENKSDRFIALHELTTMVDGVLMTVMTIHFNLCLGTLIQNNKSKIIHEKLIQQLLQGDVIGNFLATEMGYGNNVIALETTANLNLEEKKIVIHSPTAESIKFMSNTTNIGIPKVAIVLAKYINKGVDFGVFPFIVPLYTDNCELQNGIDIIPLGYKPGYDLDNAMTRFTNVEISLENIILDDESYLCENGNIQSVITSKRKRFLTSIDKVQTGKLVLSTSMARGMAVSLKLASDYLSTKKTFAPKSPDVSIDSYKNVRAYLSSGLVKTLACRALFDETRKSKQTNNQLAVLKIVNTQLAQQDLFETREKMGLHGLFADNKVMTFLNQLPGVVTAEGDNEILLIRLGKELITSKDYDFKKLIFANDASEKLSWPYFKYKSMITARLFFKTKIQKKEIFQAWNECIESVIQLALIYSYKYSYKSLNDFLMQQSEFEGDLNEAILNSYEHEIRKYLCSKGITVDSKRSFASNDIEKIIQNKEIFFNILKVPTSIIRSPLMGNFIQNYFSKF